MTIRTVFLQFDESDWEKELAAFNDTDVDVPAATTIDGKAYKDVGVHFRGMSSYFMVPEGRKRSLNLSFDFADGTQLFNGYKTLNLLNAANDPSFLRAVIYTEIASHYLPTPKMNYMRVVINGESWGLYVNTEQFNKDFTRDFFKSTKGARWKTPGSPGRQARFTYLGDSPAEYTRFHEMTSKDDPRAWAALIDAFKVLNETAADKLEAALAPIFDVDGALKFLAVEIALVNSDDYWTRASDYSLYLDEKSFTRPRGSTPVSTTSRSSPTQDARICWLKAVPAHELSRYSLFATHSSVLAGRGSRKRESETRDARRRARSGSE